MDKIDQIIEKLKRECLTVPSSDKPKMIFVGGIPGSGKNLLIDKSKLMYKSDSFYVIDVDLFRGYFRYFTRLEDTVKLSNRIEMDILDFLINKKKNIILVGTLRAYSYINKVILDKLIPNDYDIYFHLLVTNQIESTLSAYERYLNDKENGALFPRLNRLDYINKSYEGFHNAISKYSENSYFDNNQLFIRGDNKSLPKMLYYEGDVNKAIMKEELRQLEIINGQDVFNRVDNIYKYLETSDEIYEFNNICEKVLKLDIKTRKKGWY